MCTLISSLYIVSRFRNLLTDSLSLLGRGLWFLSAFLVSLKFVYATIIWHCFFQLLWRRGCKPPIRGSQTQAWRSSSSLGTLDVQLKTTMDWRYQKKNNLNCLKDAKMLSWHSCLEKNIHYHCYCDSKQEHTRTRSNYLIIAIGRCLCCNVKFTCAIVSIWNLLF